MHNTRGKPQVILAGAVIPLRQSARDLGIDAPNLSKLLLGRGIESISVSTAKRLAVYFNFPSIESFIEAVVARREERQLSAAGGPSDLPAGGSGAFSHRSAPALCHACDGKGKIPRCPECGQATTVVSASSSRARRTRVAAA